MIRPSGGQPRPALRPPGVWPPFGRILYVLVTIISNVIYYYGLPDRRTRLKRKEMKSGEFNDQGDDGRKRILRVDSN
jgi:hypothetical protein